MPAAERQENVVTYTPRPAEARRDERDLILLEQQEWGPGCGVLTKWGLTRYLGDWFFGGDRPADEIEADSPVNCCGYGGALSIPIYVYELLPGVGYFLRTTAGEIGEGIFETVVERESVTFNLERTAGIRHPAAGILASRWLSGPWTIGGAEVAAPELAVVGREVVSPVPLFGTVELALDVRRWRHDLEIGAEAAKDMLIAGWAEFVVGLSDGGRPVGLEVTPPPGAEELAKTGLPCGRGRGGDSGHIDGPNDDDTPTATGEDKYIRCDYCEQECEDPDKENARI